MSVADRWDATLTDEDMVGVDHKQADSWADAS